MKLKLVDKDSEELDLSTPGNWIFELSQLERRLNFIERYARAGGEISSDRSEKPRKATLSVSETGETDTEFLNKIKLIYEFFSLNRAPIYLIDTDVSKKIWIEMDRFSALPNSIGTERRVELIKISLVCPDVFWESTTQTVQTENNQADNDTFIVDNTGGVDVFPILEITALDDCPQFSLTNITTGEKITVASSAFLNTYTITIDNINGTVEMNDGVNNINIANSISDGTGFFNLVPGENTIRYKSPYANSNVVVKYNERSVY